MPFENFVRFLPTEPDSKIGAEQYCERRHEGRIIILTSERMPIAAAGDARAKTESS
jgi:hypothetical protein